MLNYLEKKIYSMHEQMGNFNRETETIETNRNATNEKEMI